MHVSRPAVAAIASAALLLGLASAAPAAVLREGDPDPAFSADGAQTTGFFTDTSDSFSDVALQADGKIVAVGSAFSGTAGVITVARFLANGSPDSTFDGDGRVTTSVLGSSDAASSVAIQPDGKIVVAGHAQKGTTYNEPVLIRYKSNGALDTTFNGDGKYVADWGNDAPFKEVVVQPDGKILAGGTLQTGLTTYEFALVRFTSAGVLDPSFSGDGKLTTGVSGDDSEVESIALQPDGKIVAAGYAQQGATYGFGLARFTPSGGFDSTFSGDGKQLTLVGDNAGASSVAVMPDGRIIAVGIGSNGTNIPAAVMYLPSGTPDPSFGDNGVAAPVAPDTSDLQAVVVQPNGKLLVSALDRRTPNDAIAVLRLNTDSTLDATFGQGGVATIAPVGSTNASIGGLALQRDGKVLVAGGIFPGTDFQSAVVRFLGDRTAPFGGRVLGLSRWSTSLRPGMFWLASDDNTGVKSFDLRQRVTKATAASYGSYSTVRSGTSLTAGTLTGSTGKTYCVSVRGRDWAGNAGAYGTESCVAFPVDDTDLAKTGSWTGLTGKAYYTGTARRSDDKGATLSLAGADYRHLALVATKCPGCGTVKVYRGSTLLATVKLTAGSTKNRVVIPIDASLATRSGKIKIKITSDGKPVTIDGLAVSLA